MEARHMAVESLSAGPDRPFCEDVKTEPGLY